MPLALLSPFGFSLCPGLPEGLLLGRRVTALQDSGQEQSDRSLTQGESHGCLVPGYSITRSARASSDGGIVRRGPWRS